MKKIIILLLSLLVFSCMSLRDPSTKDVGILLIPHRALNETSHEFFGNWIYGIEDISTGDVVEYRIPHYDGGGVLYLNPGTYKVSYYRFYFKNLEQGAGDYAYLDQDITFSIDQGAISILPLTFTSCVGTNGARYTAYPSLDYTNSADKTMAINAISKKDGFELWYINN